MTVFEASLRDKYIDSVVNFSAFYNIFINIITELRENLCSFYGRGAKSCTNFLDY